MKLEIVITFSLASASINAFDYCSEDCWGYKHIGCKETNPLANGAWGPKCVDGAVIEMTPEVQQALLGLHNTNRNKFALGEIEHYEPASRMATVKWDAELSKLAEIKARDCLMEHTRCQTTEKHPDVGQNLALGSVPLDRNHIDWPKTLSDLGYGFFNEQRNGKYYGWMKPMKQFLPPFAQDDKNMGHFQQFVRSGMDAVGCAAVKYMGKTDDGNPVQKVHLACDYGLGMPNPMQPVYDIGPTASKCETGTNPQYPGLCSENEDFNQTRDEVAEVDVDDLASFLPPGAIISS